MVSNQNKDALIIDPGSDEKSIASFINKKNLIIRIVEFGYFSKYFICLYAVNIQFMKLYHFLDFKDFAHFAEISTTFRL